MIDVAVQLTFTINLTHIYSLAISSSQLTHLSLQDPFLPYPLSLEYIFSTQQGIH